MLEIGPGPGGLTRALLLAGAEVVAVERDDRCVAALAELGNMFPDRLTLLNDDALALDHDALMAGPYHVVANLPYNIATALLVKWLTPARWPPRWRSLTLMFQREVADRIVAEPGSKDYGRLSVLSQWRSDAALTMKVHRSAFTPPPKVMSAVVHIKPGEEPPGVDAATLGTITAAAFGQRRKMLRQSLKPLPGAVEALDKLKIDSRRRAETLAVEDFVAITRVVKG